MFKKILIANRGEIALRIVRTCRDLGIKTVAIYSLIDKDAMHVRLADESVCIGKSSIKNSYLNSFAILSAAEITNSDAIHPGAGFFSENYEFSSMVKKHKINFIGPTSEQIQMFGDIINAKKLMKKNNFPVVILRFYQVYGPNQNKDRLIPMVIKSKYITSSSGFFTGCLNLTIDKAPTIPRDRAILFCITEVIT